MNYQKLDAYAQAGHESVKGWCNREIYGLIRVLNDIQLEKNIQGTIGEIGVYHGKFFIGMHLLRRESETTLAVDIFDKQELNIDASGVGASESIFRKNLAQHAGEPHNCRVLAADSLGFSNADVTAIESELGKFRFFSVDGGHTAEHTINDFQIAEQLLAPYGIAIVDDYYNPHWHGVIEGIAYLYLNGRPRLAPFAYAGNKHFFAPLSCHAWYRAQLESALRAFPNHCNAKHIKMYGHDMISLKFAENFYEAVRERASA